MIIVVCKMSTLDGNLEESFMVSTGKLLNINAAATKAEEFKRFKEKLPSDSDYKYTKIYYDLYIDETKSTLILEKLGHSEGVIYRSSKTELTPISIINEINSPQRDTERE